MNKILLNGSARNHIKVFPMKDIEGIPLTDKERYAWMEERYKTLQNSKKANKLYLDSNKRKGYLVGVWELDGIIYLVMSIRTAKGVFNNVIYMSKNKEDLVAIAKFLVENITEISNSFKENLDKMEELVNAINRADDRESPKEQEDISA